MDEDSEPPSFGIGDLQVWAYQFCFYDEPMDPLSYIHLSAPSDQRLSKV